ncbi:hypothetical protein [Streptomyces sp. NBC_00338]|uniref:hypothetical protein n=1 Tax=Streptomyces sp. NBC_00338 TaxID=2975715 RepID=UPI002259B646|nr:hypothetical protein [Streptomyces sp. NBC_00338]MCX5145099.1 hypothetical protein [Streptomyces sp. NBC_00338]
MSTPMSPDREQEIRERLVSTLKPQKSEIADLLAEVDRLRAELEQSAGVTRAYRRQRNAAEAEVDRLRSALSAAKAELAKQDGELSDTRDQIDALNARCDALKGVS